MTDTLSNMTPAERDEYFADSARAADAPNLARWFENRGHDDDDED